MIKSPNSTKPDTSRNFQSGRQSHPFKTNVDNNILPPPGSPSDLGAYNDWHKSQLQSTLGNRNMQYAKSKRQAQADAIFNDQELNLVSKETGSQKRDQLAFLNQKVRQFEEKVAREE